LEENKQIGLENADEASSPSGIAGLLFVAGSGLRRSHKSVVVTGDHLVIARGMWLFFNLIICGLVSLFFHFSFYRFSHRLCLGITKKPKIFQCPPVVCLSHFVKTESCVSLDKESF
jgi:hypothetical protein